MIYIVLIFIILFFIFNMKKDNRKLLWYLFLIGMASAWNAGIGLFIILIIMIALKG